MTRKAFVRERQGYFAIGIAGSKTPENLGTLWRSASLYEAAFVFTVGKRYTMQASDTTKTWAHTPLLHFTDMDDLIAHLPHSCPLVAVELTDTAVPLASFTHPQRACYLLGAEDHGLTPTQLARCHRTVQIETALPYSMNVAVAGSLILHDRHVKARCHVLTDTAVAS